MRHACTQRRLDSLEVVDIWADGLYVKSDLEDSRAALLVLIGALTDVCKVVLRWWIAISAARRPFLNTSFLAAKQRCCNHWIPRARPSA